MVGKEKFYLFSLIFLIFSLECNRFFYKPVKNIWQYWDIIQARPGWLGRYGDNSTCSKIVAGKKQNGYPDVINKTVYEARTKYVIVVGLEGTGHHFLQSLFQDCEICYCFNEISKQVGDKTLGGFRLVSHGNRFGLFGSKTKKKDIKEIYKNFRSMMPFLKSLEVDGKEKTIFLNTLCSPSTQGMMSYPNYVGECHKLQFPDVRILADIFEEHNLDLRVLVLVRNGLDVLLSTVVHRNFAPWKLNAELYLDLMKDHLISRQIKRISSGFIKCIDYDSLPELPHRLGDFLGISEDVFNLTTESFQKFRHKRNASVEKNERELYAELDIENLYAKLDTEMKNLMDIINC